MYSKKLEIFHTLFQFSDSLNCSLFMIIFIHPDHLFHLFISYSPVTPARNKVGPVPTLPKANISRIGTTRYLAVA